MTAPFHARDITGKGRYYGACQDNCPLGNQLYMSVTNAQGIVDKPALAPAAAKVTAEAAWERLPQMVATSRQQPEGECAKKRVADRCGVCRFCVTSAIKGEYRQQWESKAELGTAVHAAAHAHLIGQPHHVEPEVEPFIPAFLNFLEDFGVDLDKDIIAAETTVFSEQHGYAGTGDVWVKLPGFGSAGRRGLVLVDIKTSVAKPETAVYRDQVLQLAGLRYAERAVLVDDSEIPVPRFAATALLNLRPPRVITGKNGNTTVIPAKYALIPVPGDKTAYDAFLAALTLQRFFHDSVDTRGWVPSPAPVLRKVS